MKREHWLYLVAAVCGAAIWILVALASGRKEAWDSGLYFSMGIPAVCLMSMAFAFVEPNRSWRWGPADDRTVCLDALFSWTRQSIAAWSDRVWSAVGATDHCGTDRCVHCHKNS
jgi:hypothetical protein